MAVHIRLQRRGAPHRSFFHVVAADHRSRRNGRFLEKIGHYDPNTEPSSIVLKEDRLQHWFSKGAQLTPATEMLVKVKKIALNREKTKQPSK